MKDYYYILGTDIKSTDIDITTAYIKLSKKFNPDLNQNDYYKSHFKDINTAYETLIDPAKRSKYDKALKKFKSHYSAPESKAPAAIKQPTHFKTNRIDLLFTAILIALTFLFGYYVWHAISSKKAKASLQTVAAVPVVKHAKKRHKTKVKPVTKFVPVNTFLARKQITDSGTLHIAKTLPVLKKAPEVIKPAIKNDIDNKVVLLAVEKPAAIAKQPTAIDGSSIYESYVKANLTGKVNMREHSDYSSAIVEVIPDNSKVSVFEKGPVFYKVMFNSKIGYLPKWTVLNK